MCCYLRKAYYLRYGVGLRTESPVLALQTVSKFSATGKSSGERTLREVHEEIYMSIAAMS